jgi:hypothetical protein
MIYNMDVSLPKSLIVLYILIGNSLIQPLLSKQWIAMVEQNRIAQHIIALTTLALALTFLFSELSNQKIIFYSIICYTLFLFTTKMDVQFNIIIVSLVVIIYFYERTLDQENEKIVIDKVLTENEKQQLIEKNKKNKVYFTLVFITLTILGTLLYSHKKEVQYGGGYSITNFLLN